MRFTRSVHLRAPAAAAFAWHERPGAFARLTPPWENISVEHDDGRLTNGARVTLRATVGPIPTRWTVEHRDYVAGQQFRDVQLSGPFASWSHLHRIEAESLATSVLHDEIDYQLPFGALGAIGGGAFARAQLDRLFTYRHAVTAADIDRHQRYSQHAPLRIAVSGSTGLIGSALIPFLTTGGHTVIRLLRSRPAAGSSDVQWDPSAGRLDPRALDGVDAVVHLAGESVSARWSGPRKELIRRSRVDGTGLIAQTIAQLDRPPRVLVSASAVGLYGDRGDEVLDERAAPGRGFLADVVRAWEDAADPARAAGVRVVHPRLGVVLSARGGALPSLMRPFQLGAGGPLGDGRMWLPWVALDDVVGALHFALMTDQLTGPFNLVAPTPVTNASFAHTLGHVLHRPAFIATPAFVIRLALGAEQANEMVLASQRVVPRALLDAGFEFGHPELEDALRFELGRA